MGQVYQYEAKYLLTSVATGQLHVPTVNEREPLLGFDHEYLQAPVDDRTSFKARFATCASLIGNSFCVHVIGFLLRELFQQEFDLALVLVHVYRGQSHSLERAQTVCQEKIAYI